LTPTPTHGILPKGAKNTDCLASTPRFVRRDASFAKALKNYYRFSRPCLPSNSSTVSIGNASMVPRCPSTVAALKRAL